MTYTNEMDNIIKTLKQQGLTYTEIASVVNKQFGMSKSSEAIRKRYYRIRSRPDHVFVDETPEYIAEDVISVEDDVFVLGVISDTHLGSKYHAEEELKDFYEFMRDHKVQHVLHAGDVLEGDGWLFRGQLYDILSIGIDNILDYVVENYPTYEGLVQHVISGQHDEIFTKRYGYNILNQVSLRRDDIIYYGSFMTYLTLQHKNQEIHIVLQHGSNSLTTAHSYRLQKYVDVSKSMFADGFDMLILGHYHSMAILPEYKRVISIMPGCFQHQTKLFAEKGLVPVIGGLILKIHFTDNGWHVEYITRTYPVKTVYMIERG